MFVEVSYTAAKIIVLVSCVCLQYTTLADFMWCRVNSLQALFNYYFRENKDTLPKKRGT